MTSRHIRAVVLACSLLAFLPAGCSTGTGNGSTAAPSGGPSVIVLDPNANNNVRAMAAVADSYAITYGALTPSVIDTLRTYPLVIVHPYNGNITRDQIMQIKQGVDADDPGDNPVVLCYLSIGEDSRTYRLTDAQMRADGRFTGSGTGPSIDPRGANAGGSSLVGVDPLGTPTNGGFASYYLNDNAVRCKGAADGSPDQNGHFLTRFVNAGDPAWYATVKSMRMDSDTHTPPGLDELFGNDYGRSLGCDGVFLDTIDTAAPNKFTSCDDVNHTTSEWTAKGFADFIRRVRADYPDRVILQNRGLFFFDPREPQYQVSARGAIDIGFFESYYLDNNADTVVSPYFADNKYNMAPKIMAEANRPDGFKMLSLGYASGFGAPKQGIDLLTLLGSSNLGYDILMTDVSETLSVGFRHYITSAEVDFVNPFVRDNASLVDTTAPRWNSVFNATYNPPAAAAPRTGIQRVDVTGAGSVMVSWDVALDLNRVRYLLYYRTTPFDFAADPMLSSATRRVLTPDTGTGYETVWDSQSPNLALEQVYPYQAAVDGLTPGVPHYFVIRAVDSLGNEDDNEVVLTATP